MRNRWNDAESGTSPLQECAYGSRLIGGEPTLVLHGGGNTSVKTTVRDVTGAETEVLYVKGSGHDLASIQPAGFAPLRLARLRELLTLDALSDEQMVNELRCALLDASAPDPSVETLLHAVLPHPAVQHSHADAILSLTNLPNGEDVVREVFGDDVVVFPYVMPGFDLAALGARLWAEQGRPDTLGLVLLNHGLFSFGADTREAYARHIDLITRAERYLEARVTPVDTSAAPALPPVPRTELAELRRRISEAAGAPVIVSRQTDAATAAFVSRPDLAEVSTRGPLTPDHVIRTKLAPMVGSDVAGYADAYREYFGRHHQRRGTELTQLDPAPRVVLDPRLGMLTVGRRAKDADIARDIYQHTMQVIAAAEQLGGYQPASEEHIFDLEYWDLEQAKLRRAGSPPPFAGEVALVTGAASGIGRACVKALLDAGASVVGWDVADAVTDAFSGPEYLGQRLDVTDEDAVSAALDAVVERFGGLDMVVPCAGVFRSGMPVAELDPAAWRQSMAINADSVATLYRLAHPLLAASPRGGRVVLIASKNVPAPGPGAAAYSASKAAVTQLSRVAALEWAQDGIRVNVVHPDAVFDTGLWTPEIIAQRAASYGMDVDAYKRRNLLHTEVSSATVGAVVARLCSPEFAATTGAQIPVDGGSDRVI
ncbi:short-chain dehydrogenase [Wenjunlia vitaminophila]|uniref:Short-chain dehydrogenase n=1 Tax=Wenjunlia vitaminophila TaxID=76728 RepID=A0A0T6LZ49_WENVI|nr:bifunctional aldolase/short-chain dehydrogenase [Wenjunlia vitaminophila]KRV51297.1 short-chain dehydrogenase [Wenjunlia vitaminophila]